ncbi:MAG: FN3 associated domain-containing protein, partial [Clostridia bacterium]
MNSLLFGGAYLMTKKWLSLVLVLTLLASLFSGAAMAAGDVALVFTKDASLSEIKLEAGKVYNMPIGTITNAGETITTEQWQAIRNDKFTVTAANAVTAANTYVSQAGVLSVAFTAAATATTNPVVATLETKSLSGYSLAVETTGLTFSVEVPVASIATKTWNGSDAYTSVKSMTIDTNPSQPSVDKDYALYVGGLPTTATVASRTPTVVSADATIVEVGAPRTSLPSGTGRDEVVNGFRLTGKRPGSTTLTISAGGKSINFPVTVKETNLTSLTLSYTNAAANGTGLMVGETEEATVVLAPTYATKTDLTYSTVNEKLLDTSVGNVVDIDSKTGKLTARAAGTAQVVVTSTVPGVTPVTVNIKTIARNNTNVAVPTIVAKPAVGEASTSDGTSSNAYTMACEFVMATTTDGAKIYYTMDDSEPTAASTLYTQPIVLDTTATKPIKAIAVKDGWTSTKATPLAETYLHFALKATKIEMPKTLTIEGATETTITAVVTPELSKLAALQKEVTWTSSAADVIAAPTATDLAVKVTPLKAGKVTLTATTESGKAASCVVTVTDVKATRVTLNKNTATLPANETLTLTAEVTPANAFVKDVNWTTSASGIATVADGVVTHVAAGTAVITASCGNLKDACVVTTVAPATKVATPTLKVVKADGTPVSGTTFDVTTNDVVIASATTGAAYVIEAYKDGVKQPSPTASPVELNANGTYVINAYATKDDMITSDPVTATYTVSVPVKKITIDATNTAGVVFDATKKTLVLDGKVASGIAMTATLDPATGADVGTPAYEWKSSDATVAVIYNKETKVADKTYAANKLYALKDGTAVITVTTTGKAAPVSDSVTVTVKKLGVVTVTIDDVQDAKAGQEKQLTAVVRPDGATNSALTWSIVSGAENASITADGLITYKAKGNVTVKAEAKDGSGVSGTKVITILAADPAVAVPTVKFDGTAQVAGAVTITGAGKVEIATVTTGAVFKYTTDGSTPSAINGTVYTGAFVLPSNCSTFKVLATKDGMTAAAEQSFTITWDVYPTEIKVEPSKTTVEVGGTFELKVTYTPANAKSSYVKYEPTAVTGMTYTTDAATGIVKVKVDATAALGKNTFEVVSNTFNTNKTVKGTCDVIITEAKIASIEVVPATDGDMYIGGTKQLNAVVLPATVADKSVTWMSNKTSVASVDANGVVTANAPGSAVVTATSKKDGTKTGSYTVTVVLDPAITPVAPATRPTLTMINQSFEVIENGDKKVELAKFDAAAYEAIKYYYNMTLSLPTITDYTGSAELNVSKDGVISLVLRNAAPGGTYNVSFDWSLTKITGRTANNYGTKTETGYSLKVVGKPTMINFTNAAVAAIEMKDTETKTVELGTITNYADFKKTGVAVSATATQGAVSISDAGVVTLTLDKPAVTTGAVKVSATLTATGCTAVKTKEFDLTVIKNPVPAKKEITVDAKSGAYKGSKGAYNVSLTDKTIALKVNGYVVSNWATSSKKYLTVDANGAATL